VRYGSPTGDVGRGSVSRCRMPPMRTRCATPGSGFGWPTGEPTNLVKASLDSGRRPDASAPNNAVSARFSSC
jgi:hypothetical protein